MSGSPYWRKIVSWSLLLHLVGCYCGWSAGLHMEHISFGIAGHNVEFSFNFAEPSQLVDYKRHIEQHVGRSGYPEELKPSISLVLTLALEERVQALGYNVTSFNPAFFYVPVPPLLQPYTTNSSKTANCGSISQTAPERVCVRNDKRSEGSSGCKGEAVQEEEEREPRHELLTLRSRVVYIWTPDLWGNPFGGYKALHALASALALRGFRTQPFTQANASVVQRDAMPGDIVVITEAPICDKVVEAITHARGMRTVRWILATDRRYSLPPPPPIGHGGEGGGGWPMRGDGIPFPKTLRVDGTVALASTHFIQTRLPFATRHTTVFSPLDSVHYDRYHQSKQQPQAAAGPAWAKRRLVVIDDDNHNITVALPEDVELIDLSRVIVAGAQMPQLFQSAMLLVDMHVPGAERAIYEAALCGALPLLTQEGNGGDPIDFPLPASLRVDPSDSSAVDEAVHMALRDYHRLLPQLQSLIAHTLNQPHAFSAAVDAAFSSFSLQVVISSSTSCYTSGLDIACSSSLDDSDDHDAGYGEARRIFTSLLAGLYHYPLARFHVSVPHLPSFLHRHAPLIDFLADNGLTSTTTGGQEHHFLHFREASAAPGGGDVSCSLPRGFPVTLVLRPGLVIYSSSFLHRALHSMTTTKKPRGGGGAGRHDSGSSSSQQGVCRCLIVQRSSSRVVGVVVVVDTAEIQDAVLCHDARLETEDVVGEEEGSGGEAGKGSSLLLEAWGEWVREQQEGEEWEPVAIVTQLLDTRGDR